MDQIKGTVDQNNIFGKQKQYVDITYLDEKKKEDVEYS